MSGYIEPFPLRDATVLFTIWRLGQFDYEVRVSYIVRGEIGHDDRIWPFRSLETARNAIPPWAGAMMSPDPAEDPPELVEAWT